LRLCDFKPTDIADQGQRKFRCARCGYVTRFIPDRGQRIHRKCNRQSEGLGNKVARWLSYVGITKPRMEVIAGGDCGCEERQEKLNQVGWQLADWLTFRPFAARSSQRSEPE
jgi:hypothetical protein